MINKQAETCHFKADDKHQCTITTEMICNKKICTLYLDKNSEKAKRLKQIKIYK